MSQANAIVLAMMRRTMGEYLKDTCILRKPSTSVDDRGNQTELFIIAATGVACRMLPYNRQDNVGLTGTAGQGAVEQGRAMFRLILPYETEIGDGWQVIYPETPEAEQQTFEFVQLQDTFTDQVDKRVLVTRLG